MKSRRTPMEPAELKASKGQEATKLDFPIVGIGASAGGLEALELFFENVPADSGMAFVVIQHLDPNYVGILPELLQRTTELNVTLVTDHLLVKPNQVYVIPRNKSMSIQNGYLNLLVPVEVHGLRLPIDYFFYSLAEDKREKSIGVILSGMGSDGSLGMKAIKERNGTTVVQDPLTTKFDGMPQSALRETNIDILGPAQELPSKLISYLFESHSLNADNEMDDKKRSNLGKIILLLRSQTGHDFALYKKNTLIRRIERRMNVHQIEKLASYVRFLQENPGELDVLFDELLIGVTNFFRDASVWEKLKAEVLPELFKELPDNYVIRVWVTGCSTGEEAYSMAIIFLEVIEKLKIQKGLKLQIFATDIDSDAIDIARKGVYAGNIITDVSSERLDHFFSREGTGFRVNAVIREMVVFATHNVIKDPPFTKLDMVMCRNMLIYMEAELQKKLFNLFHYSLNAGGIMLLGSAESDNSQSLRFTPIDSKLKLYKRSIVPISTELVDFPSAFIHSPRRKTEEVKVYKRTDIQTIADQIVLQRFAPASVLINSEGDILYITGRTGKYLEPAAGRANMNIYDMAREGLRNVLPGAIRNVKQNYEPIKFQRLKVATGEKIQLVDVTLQLLDRPDAVKSTIMIVFADVEDLHRATARKLIQENQDFTFHEQKLELELQRANEELQSTREEMQTTQEELISTNEEMQSTNEELQSANEELTTSKEEMQSLNEELQTVNIELQSKIADYMVAQNDMKNLLNSTDIATLFLDKELKIRRFTDQMVKLFKFRQSDVGRPFTDLVNDLQYPEMVEHSLDVLRTLVFRETDIPTHDNRWYTVRIMPYRTFNDHIDGLVITFIDITHAKNLEMELNNAILILTKHKIYPNDK